MKKMLLVSVALGASLSIAGCNRGATTNTPAPANKATTSNAAAPAGNSAGGNSAAGGAASEAPVLNFTNQSGQAIITLQVSATGENQWGEDILGRDTLPNGETTQIEFDRAEDRCFWDFRATYEGGGESDNRNVNLCESGGAITMLPPSQ